MFWPPNAVFRTRREITVFSGRVRREYEKSPLGVDLALFLGVVVRALATSDVFCMASSDLTYGHLPDRRWPSTHCLPSS